MWQFTIKKLQNKMLLTNSLVKYWVNWSIPHY